ncbi:uncharacterized protein LOC117116945 [Anneissia japonica]|uniref:uncharacterized protein LOC117116945 n=1 Tax=Anneissia japonica TaxID=1529436 RepID=UPI001425B242|nr:uncharacterized protein LOC117116945 [Anneissia japonica]
MAPGIAVAATPQVTQPDAAPQVIQPIVVPDNVSATPLNNAENIYYLEQFTSGKANRIVSGFAHLDADVGYPAAMKELRARFGDPEVIANAYVKKVLSWPQVRADDPHALDELSILLIECETATQSIGRFGVLEFAENLKIIISKLLYSLQERWELWFST